VQVLPPRSSGLACSEELDEDGSDAAASGDEQQDGGAAQGEGHARQNAGGAAGRPGEPSGQAASADGAADEDPDPASDSSEDERPRRNTVGPVPLEWYRGEEHIGYDVEGQKLARKARRDRLDKLIARNDSSKVCKGASLGRHI
jgi:ribosome biogenesis protein ERB1